MSSNTSERASPHARYTSLAVRSVLSEPKNLSIAELSQPSPVLLMLHVMPCSPGSVWKCSPVY
ncbi:MAG: hypothetical protein A3E51_10190 [Burkholderiales bacterium RIFCSPHIGHO2_12_FULL_67_38]|nr:MAG: hypothetical protein A3E51_10190 [Burkholderiales bacterium RIFCSPHIGHO2_12_FULL_67_38]